MTVRAGAKQGSLFLVVPKVLSVLLIVGAAEDKTKHACLFS